MLVTAALLALAVPPALPWWLIAFGTAVAVLIGKHAYGGLGPEPVQPGDGRLRGAAGVVPARDDTVAGRAMRAGTRVTGATALDALRTGLRQGYTMQEIFAGPAFGRSRRQRRRMGQPRGARRRRLTCCCAGSSAGRSRSAMLAGPRACRRRSRTGSTPAPTPGALFHLASGATMLGAFFIATDPVSAATSDRGRLVYGAGIGLLTWIIRSWGGFPDGVAFAVLLMNLAVPLIDRYTVPRIHGHPR